MKRYHRQVYFPAESKEQLNDFTERLNCLNWTYSVHCLENIRYRTLEVEKLLKFIKGLTLCADDIFEYYQEQEIEKVCYRIPYIKGIDIILVVSKIKNIITIYMNEARDKHETLNNSVYCKN